MSATHAPPAFIGVSLCWHDHSLAEFVGDDTTLTLDFGSVPQWSSPAALSYAIENVLGSYRVDLGYDSLISATGDTGKFNVILPTGLANLPTGSSSGPYLVSVINTTVPGYFEAIYTLGFSDDSVLNGAQEPNAQTLTLTVKGFVRAPVPEPGSAALIGLGLLGLVRRRRRA